MTKKVRQKFKDLEKENNILDEINHIFFGRGECDFKTRFFHITPLVASSEIWFSYFYFLDTTFNRSF